MNKIIKVTQNELTKQFKKKSIVIMLIMIMSLGIVIPVVSKFIKTDNITPGSGISFGSEQLTSGKTDKEKVQNIFIKGQNASSEINLKAGLEPEDWRTSTVQSYESNYITLLYLEAVQEGLSKEAILKDGMNYNREYFEKAITSNETLKKAIVDLKEKINIEKDIILNKNYIEFLKIEIKTNENTLKDLEEEKKEEIKNNTEEKELIVKELEVRIKNIKDKLEIYKYRLENKIDFSKDNWKNKTLLNIEKIDDKLNAGMLTKESFAMESNMKMTYEDYVANYNKTKEGLENEKALDWYSLKNNIPQMQYETDARTIVDFGYNIFVVLSILVVILIGGGIVAGEFAQGTIRLLVIRPIKRGKILLAKLLALLIIGFGIIFVGTLILAITSGVVYGFGGYGQNILSIGSAGIVEKSFLIFLIKSILISSGSLIFMIGLVFFISTVVKNSSLAVLVGTIAYLGALPLAIGLAMYGAKWIAYTPLPYINESILNIVPFFKEIFTVYTGVSLNAGVGFSILAIIGVVLVVLSYIVFNKKDIKN